MILHDVISTQTQKPKHNIFPRPSRRKTFAKTDLTDFSIPHRLTTMPVFTEKPKPTIANWSNDQIITVLRQSMNGTVYDFESAVAKFENQYLIANPHIRIMNDICNDQLESAITQWKQSSTFAADTTNANPKMIKYIHRFISEPDQQLPEIENSRCSSASDVSTHCNPIEMALNQEMIIDFDENMSDDGIDYTRTTDYHSEPAIQSDDDDDDDSDIEFEFTFTDSNDTELMTAMTSIDNDDDEQYYDSDFPEEPIQPVVEHTPPPPPVQRKRSQPDSDDEDNDDDDDLFADEPIQKLTKYDSLPQGMMMAAVLFTENKKRGEERTENNRLRALRLRGEKRTEDNRLRAIQLRGERRAENNRLRALRLRSEKKINDNMMMAAVLRSEHNLLSRPNRNRKRRRSQMFTNFEDSTPSPKKPKLIEDYTIKCAKANQLLAEMHENESDEDEDVPTESFMMRFQWQQKCEEQSNEDIDVDDDDDEDDDMEPDLFALRESLEVSDEDDDLDGEDTINMMNQRFEEMEQLKYFNMALNSGLLDITAIHNEFYPENENDDEELITFDINEFTDAELRINMIEDENLHLYAVLV